MPNDLTLPDPARFGLERFADLLPARDHIIGEDPGSFDGFHEGLMQSLAPLTPYEGVIAENLIAIEWELVQHRRMRDVGLRAIIRKAIKQAVLAREEAAHEALLDEHFDKHQEAGGTQDDWEEPVTFDRAAAEATAHELSVRALSRDPSDIAAVTEEIDAMGLNVVELMGEAYSTHSRAVGYHDGKLQELERRRRDVKRDFDLLQRGRPVDVGVIEG